MYDGSNPVQEIQNGAPSANLLTGLGVDEYFSRTDSSGARDYLTDILGSTLALTDSNGANQTSYAYDPFGNTTTSGASSTNPFQFTGREDDTTGLYFYRARYYSPTLGRFVSQDPVGISGGINLYAYTFDDPINLIDVLGLDAYLCDRPIKGLHWEVGPAYHQYICVVSGDATYCFGLTTNGNWFDAPGSLEGDKFNKSCTGQSSKKCVDSCLLGLAEEPPPNYSLPNWFGGMNCHKFATSAVAYCQAQCASPSGSAF